MSDPQLSSIRGADHRTLSDLFSKVEEVSSKMADMTTLFADVNQIAVDIRKFVGANAAPSGWNGIMDAIGVRTNDLDYQSVLGRLRVMMNEAVEQGLLMSAGNAVRASMRDELALFHGDSNTLSADRNTTLAAANVLLEAIKTALKQDGELPSDTSIFRLIASIDTVVAQIKACTCDGANPTDPYTPTTPTANCAGESSVWQECQLLPFESSGTDEYRVYRVVFPTSLTSAPALGDVNVHNTLPDPGLSHLDSSYGAGIDYTVCIRWDYSPADTIYNYDIGIREASDPNQFNSFFSSTPAVPNQGGESVIFQPYIDGSDTYVVQMNIAFTGTTPPVGKVYVTAVESIPS